MLALVALSMAMLGQVQDPNGPIVWMPLSSSAPVLTVPPNGTVCSGTATGGNGVTVTTTRSNSRGCACAADASSYVVLGNNTTCTEPLSGGGAGVSEWPSHVNVAQQSAALATSPWSADASVVVTVDQGDDPSGAATADEVDNTAATNTSGATQAVTVSSSAGPFTYSSWVAMTSGTGTAGIALDCGGAVSAQSCACSRADGAACTASTSGSECRVYSSFGASAARMAATLTCASVVTSITVKDIPGQPGASTGTALYSWAMLNTGSVADPYCPTTSASKTCGADVTTVSTTNWPVPAMGLAVEFDLVLQAPLSGSQFLLDTRGGGVSGVLVYFSSPTSFAIFSHDSGTNAAQYGANLSWTVGQKYHIKAAWSANGMTLYRDGVSVAAGSSVFSGPHAATAHIGSSNSSNQQIAALISNFKVERR